MLKQGGWNCDETNLLAISVDNLLSGLGLSRADRLAWYKKQTNARAADVSVEFRKRKDSMRAALGNPSAFFSDERFGSGIIQILNERGKVLEDVGKRFAELEREKKLSKSLEELYASFVHLHLNRVSSASAPSERLLLGLLERTLDSLRNAPAAARNGRKS
jgi:thiopeptide-type bacteriocin biosynthesis protein